MNSRLLGMDANLGSGLIQMFDDFSIKMTCLSDLSCI